MAATCWVVEPAYAQNRLFELQAASPVHHPDQPTKLGEIDVDSTLVGGPAP